MTRCFAALLGCVLVLSVAGTSQAHFGMIIPDKDVVAQEDKTLRLTLAFAHPFEQHGMDMARPREFGVVADGAKADLTGTLTEATVMGKKAWKTTYAVKKPGVYTFFTVPEPYFEPAEDIFIAHYPKVVVAAFGEEEGWDAPVGLPVEIVPLTRPFANYAGSVFTGRVLQNGKPVPGAVVEAEYDNEKKDLTAPNEYLVTQVVKADDNGVFTFACPRAGWWGFSALLEGDAKLKKDGEDKDVELGAVIWVKMTDFKKK